MMIPATAVLSLFLFGIEELSTQLEEPFTILPMQAFCDKIYNWCTEIMTWSPGDNGTQVKPVKPEHAYFAAVSAPPPTQYVASSPPPAAVVGKPPSAPQQLPPQQVEQQQQVQVQQDQYQPAQQQQKLPQDFADFLRNQRST